MKTLSIHINTATSYQIRQVTHEGKPHLVVPVVMMVEGVHSGSQGPILHTSAELGRFPASWNGIPVVVKHPQNSEGVYVSANSPDMIETAKVGRIYNTSFENNKLRAEAWLEISRLNQVSAVALAYIRQGRPMDVSVGVFTDTEESTGEFNGETYSGIARNHRPDHLALLPGEQGACSWADGCGIRVNSTNKKGGYNVYEKLTVNLRYEGTESSAWKSPSLADFGVEGQWQDLPQADRTRIANHYLIGSASAGSFAELKLPVVNPKTGALNERALRAVISGRGAAVEGVSATVLSSARRKAYRLLNSEFEAELEIPETLEAMRDFAFEQLSANVEVGLRGKLDKIRSMVDSMDSEVAIHFLEEVWDSYYIYAKRVRNNSSNPIPEEYYRQNYMMDEQGNIQLVGEPVKVLKTIQYTIVPTTMKRTKLPGGKTQMDTNGKSSCFLGKVERLIQSNQTQFTDQDKEWLLTQEEATLDKLMPKPNLEANADQMVQAFRNTIKTEEDLIKAAPESMQASIRAGFAANTEKRNALVEKIMANAAEGTWTKEELAVMEMSMLEKVGKSIKVETTTDYSLNGGNPPIHNNAEGEILLPPGVK